MEEAIKFGQEHYYIKYDLLEKKWINCSLIREYGDKLFENKVTRHVRQNIRKNWIDENLIVSHRSQ